MLCWLFIVFMDFCPMFADFSLCDEVQNIFSSPAFKIQLSNIVSMFNALNEIPSALCVFLFQK